MLQEYNNQFSSDSSHININIRLSVLSKIKAMILSICSLSTERVGGKLRIIQQKRFGCEVTYTYEKYIIGIVNNILLR